MRRPSFWRKFLVYLAALFFAFEAAASVYMLTASVRYRNDKVKEYDQYYQYLCDMLRNKVRYCYYDTNLNPLKNEVKYILCTLYERYGVSSRFFINNEPVADSSATYFLIDSNCVMVDLQKAGTPFSTYYVMGDYSDTNKSVEQLEKYLRHDSIPCVVSGREDFLSSDRAQALLGFYEALLEPGQCTLQLAGLRTALADEAMLDLAFDVGDHDDLSADRGDGLVDDAAFVFLGTQG